MNLLFALDDSFFKKLNEEEEEEFREWARENYAPGDKIHDSWHPVVRDECNKINKVHLLKGE